MRARVWKSGPTWFFEVSDGQKVVNADNTNDWRVIFDQADRAVRAFAAVQHTGHRFRSWQQVVERSGPF